MHVANGGDLVVFPEGTSEWGYAPGPYRTGAARIWCELRERGIEPEAIAAALFYSAPDRFRSIAEVRLSEPVLLPEREGRSDADWRAEVHRVAMRALDEVSVRCPDAATFDAVQYCATERARGGESFAPAFLEEQRAATQSAGTAARTVAGTAKRAVVSTATGSAPVPTARAHAIAAAPRLSP